MNNKIFRFLYKFHVYGGLFSSAFFIIIGITSVNYNHPELFEKKNFREKAYVKPFSFHSDSANIIIRHALDSLNIFGHQPWWLQRIDKENNLHFQIIRPGKQYQVVALEKEKQLKVTEKSMGIMHTMAGMHVGSSGMPKSAVFTFWTVYSHAAVTTGLLSLILSIYFWIRKSKLKKWQWASAGSAFMLSIFYILFIWLIG
jgi:hypothetical protein